MFTDTELYERAIYGDNNSIQLSYEDACTFQKILLANGYAVLMTDGDIGDKYRIDWVYAGDIGNLEYADREQIAFGHRDFVEMLYWNDYKVEEEE